MAHPQQIEFCKSVKQQLPTFFAQRLVLDIGSLDINGNNQYLFDDCQYIGVDLAAGRNVDLISAGHQLGLPDASVDVIISTECFEHDQFYALTLKNIVRMLKPGGLFVFSCATTGRPEHGTRRTSPADAPFTQQLGDWGDYYKNLTEADIRDVFDLDTVFQQCQFSIGEQTHDLYFWGIKSGSLTNRQDYSFQIQQGGLRAELKTRETFIGQLLAVITNRDSDLAQNQAWVAERTRQVFNLEQTLVQRDAQIRTLEHDLLQRQAQIHSLEQSLVQRDAQIDKLAHAAADSQAQIAQLKQTLAQRDSQIPQLNQAVSELSTKVDSLISSKSWQITKPLRFTARILRGEVRTAIEPLSRTAASTLLQAKNGIGYVARGDFDGLIKRIKARQQDSAIASIQNAIAKPREKTGWGIMATQHTLFIAHILATRLRTHGWKVEIMTRAPASFEHDWYIVVCPQMFDRLPPGEKRIAFQMEQSVSSRWFTDTYLKTLDSSLAVLDYALTNLDFLATKNIAYPHVYYLPVGATSNYGTALAPNEKNFDVLFYGDSNSSVRRRDMLEALQQRFNVRIVNEVFGPSMANLIKQARVVINLHYYENALLETPRIIECLSLGVPVVSESSQNQGDYPELAQGLHFFEQGSIPAMLAAVQTALDNPVSDVNLQRSVVASEQRFEFMFDRFLIAMGFLPPTHVTQIVFPLPAHTRRIVLSLPETVKRRRLFEAEQMADYTLFDGIRLRPGWAGCALSYQTIARNALQQGIHRLTVLEDDVLLPPDFEAKLAVVNDYLDQRKGEWDVFAGVIAALHPDVKVIAVEVYQDVTFVEIDKMTSMVFNIYNEKTLRLLAAWDGSNLDAETNTIDRFLESQANLRVIVALPFFVGHREEVHSTLWGFQNTQYADMIAGSEQALQQMVMQ